MPLTRVQGPVNAVTTANAASLTATFPAAPTQGNLLVCCACADQTAVMTSSGWTLSISAVNSVGVYQWAKIAGASEASAVVVTPAAADSVAMTIEEYSGQIAGAIAGVLDKTASAAIQAATSSPVTGTTAATTQTDEQAIAGLGTNLSAGATFSGWTNSFAETSDITSSGSANNASLGVAEQSLIAAGAQSTSATAASGSAYSGLIATYKAAGGPILLGVNTVGTDGSDFEAAQVMIGSKYVAGATGTVDHVWMRTNLNASGTLNGALSCGIYSDSAGSPGSLVGNVDTITITAHVTQWLRSIGGMNAPVVSGTTYWIVFDFTGATTGEWYFSLHDATTTGGTKDSLTGRTTLQASFGAVVGTFNELMNAYAESLAPTPPPPYVEGPASAGLPGMFDPMLNPLGAF